MLYDSNLIRSKNIYTRHKTRMATRIETYNLSSSTEMVDINRDIENFIAKFQVRSLDGQDFKCMVIEETPKPDQTEFNTSVNGEFGGEIKAEYNNYKNYFLLLKSDQPRQVEVTISLQKLDKKPLPQPPQQSSEQDQSIQQTHVKKSSLKNILIGVGILTVLAVGGYFYVTHGKKNTKSTRDMSSSTRSPSRSDMSSTSSPYVRIPETLRHRIYKAN